MACVLFLDDDHSRHALFRERAEELGYGSRYKMLYVYSAAQAIEALQAHEGELIRAFLDHDLSEADIMVAVGAPSQVPTGMTVVEHILTMKQPPVAVTVHSYNEAAAVEMCARLSELGTIDVRRVPFAVLLHKLA
ncbi:MAG TPA: cyclic-phosphate processing receiver domain-containing protein [Kofleriaceae bacterium]|nr:cyclic-phosphate processing receiver domain-containing protein [Kofleriaceae bacterium]